jgi:hypothetical protein
MLRNVSEPMLTAFRPAKPNGIGVIVCPGGWRILPWEHEGIDPAREVGVGWRELESFGDAEGTSAAMAPTRRSQPHSSP